LRLRRALPLDLRHRFSQPITHARSEFVDGFIQLVWAAQRHGITQNRGVLQGIDDSKVLTRLQREAAYERIVAGAATKILYDVLLWVAFRRLKPPEER
jgi:hypothetical protein